MKKGLFTILAVGSLCLTGCGSQEKTMSCSRTVNQSGVSMDLSYTITYSGNTVKKVESVEKVTSSNSSTLDLYKTQVESIYAPYKDVEYYNYEVNIDGDTLTSKTDIDYSKIDTDKMLEIDSANGQLIKNGKINVDTMESYYEALGITCEK